MQFQMDYFEQHGMFWSALEWDYPFGEGLLGPPGGLSFLAAAGCQLTNARRSGILSMQASAGFVEVAGSGGSPSGWDPRSWGLQKHAS
jgi:hypothetical protein